jgi:Asp-tRNA(Asn)/Glu-tRNA(Gln) amidotransferase A subunit family amidase
MRVDGPDYPISSAALNDSMRQVKPEGRPWRVGFARTHTWNSAPEYARTAFEVLIKQLSDTEGVDVEEVVIPAQLDQAHVIHETIYNKSLSYYFKDEHRQSEFVSPIMRTLIENGNTISLADYTKAVDDQMNLLYVMDEAFNNYDVIISLSTAGEAPLRESTELPDPSLMWTLCHLPVVSVPKFYSPSGLPFGFQVAARKYNDYLLFSFIDHLRSQGIAPHAAGFALNHG